LELLFRGVKRLDKPELKMLSLREETLAREPRKTSFVSIVEPEDPLVCPSRLKNRAAARAHARLAAQSLEENLNAPPAKENVNQNEGNNIDAQ
jgi:hypothetical protein